MTVTNRRALAILIGFALLIAARLTPGIAAQQAPSTPPLHARVFGRLFIRNAMVIYGSGRPPYGPADIENLKLLNPYGADVMVVNGKQVSNDTPVGPGDRVQVVHAGGIEWTIKDGIPYHVPTLMREVKDMVAGSRRGRTTTP
jgi:hypothetical protein